MTRTQTAALSPLAIDIHSRFHIVWPFHSILSSKCSWPSGLLYHTLRDATSIGYGLLLQAIGWTRAGTLYFTLHASRLFRLYRTPLGLDHILSTTMYPPSMGYGLDIAAISGILGSISIACWVVVFSPQIIENYSKKSADGLSIEFIIIWLGMWRSTCSKRVYKS